MQQFKPKFLDPNFYTTFTNIQKCLRLNDLDEIGDGTHYLTFEMIGLFSFRDWSLQKSIDFMIEFLNRLGLVPDYVTIHPDKIKDWSHLYDKYGFEIRPDKECIWSDGNIGGYCTEFYINGVEIGNIVNPLGNCIDIGFGLERLIQVSGNVDQYSKLQILEDTCLTLIQSGVTVSSNKEGYVLKKLITRSVLEGSIVDHPYFQKVRNQQKENYKLYLKKKPKMPGKDSVYWMDTYGIDESRLDDYQRL